MRPPKLDPRSWEGLLNLAAALEAALLLVVGLVLGDLETIAFGVVVTITTCVLLAMPSRLALLLRLAVFLDVEFWMAAGAASNLAHGGGPGSVLSPLSLACVSAAGIVASAASLLRRSSAGGAAPTVVGVAVVIVFLAGLGLSAGGNGTGRSQQSSAARLSIKNARYSTTQLHARASGGVVTIEVQNQDLFWHTFTSPDLGVDERFASRARGTVAIRANRGSYRFFCAIPGHDKIGMHGTLTID
jgi:hypothetical protein